MYESSCSYAGALELKRSALKEEPWPGAEWPPYRLHQSTFEQLKQSVEKAKAALQDRSGLLGSAAAFGDLYGGQIGQDVASTTLSFGSRAARTEDSMLSSIDHKNKSLGVDKLGGSPVKGYSTPSLSESLRAPKCSDADNKLEANAQDRIGILPQPAAVEAVASVYARYCSVYNKLCECYDQMAQVQRRPFIRNLIDSITCRIMELKEALQEVEAFEYTYPHNALEQMLITPHEIEILCPFFYPFETRQQEMQYIVDEIMSGNRIGDPTPTPSEILRKEEERLEEENRIHEEKLAEIRRKQAMGEEIEIEEEAPTGIPLTPKEIEAKKLQEERHNHIAKIQAMERCRSNTRAKQHKKNQDQMTYLELAGIKKPLAPKELREKAARQIQIVCRKFMQLKREHYREKRLKERLGMAKPSYSPPSLKIQWEKVKSDRRKFRENYFQKWIKANINENTRIMRLRKDDIMEDISTEVRAWFESWYKELGLFDEYPWPDEGGSILVVRGETFTFDEYREWRTAETKRLLEEASSPKTKEEIRAEKKAAKEEKKRLRQEEIAREKKMLIEYKKSRLNPEKDPGIMLKVSDKLNAVREAYQNYRTQWKDVDLITAPLDVIRGYVMEIITENQYQDINIELRPIVDEMMRLELITLKNALKNDYLNAGITTVPTSQKRKKPKAKKKPKDKSKRSPANIFQELVDKSIVRKYSKITLDEFWGEQNYAAADLRAIPWLPIFTPPCLGDVREQLRVRCLMALGSDCNNAERATLLTGPPFSGKRTLVNAICTETNAVLMDLSPMNVYNKYPGPKNLKTMITMVNTMSRLLQPTVIIVENAEKIFYKKVPKEEKMFDPTRLKNVLFKDIIKPLKNDDKILVIGTSSEPWVAAIPAMKKAFNSVILLPRTDYASLSAVLYRLLMKYHGVNREIDIHSVAQVARGYNISSIRKAIDKLMTVERVAKLSQDPLEPVEVLSSVLVHGIPPILEQDYELFTDWYSKYSPWGTKYDEYRYMLDVQYEFKLKNDKKKKKS